MVAGTRALLKAHLAQLSATERIQTPSWFAFPRGFAWTFAATACGFLALGSFLIRSDSARQSQSRYRAVIVSIPDSTLTPGAALLVNREAVCAQPNIKNKAVPAALQMKVFEEYGIAGAEPRAYEVDYLVTPALGGRMTFTTSGRTPTQRPSGTRK